MAGHSKFKNIMHRKGAQDAKRAKIFTRLGKELSVAVKQGVDPEANPRLRAAIAACKAANMPKDNIEKVLKKAEMGDLSYFSEIRYEGFGPDGVAIIVEALTDNKNRTASEVRTVFNKFNGNLNYKEIIKSSAFCSDKDQLIKENQILNKNQIIGIIPPIGGG